MKRSIFISITKEQIQQIITGNQIHSVADVYTLLRDSFKDILQELMEAEMASKITDKILAGDFKAVYHAPTESAGLAELESIKEKWGKKYPYAIRSWEDNWQGSSAFFFGYL